MQKCGNFFLFPEREPVLSKPSYTAFRIVLVLITATFAGVARASWDGDGVRVSPIEESQVGQMITSDGLSGWFVSWSDFSTYDVFLQHLDGQGNVVVGWPSEGLTVCAAPGFQGPALMMPDGQGGVYLLWPDTRGGSGDIYLQRITDSGAISPGWPANGLAVCTAAGTQSLREQHMVLDGVGGVVVVWTDNRDAANSSRDVYARRIVVNGSYDSSWPNDGRLVGVLAGSQSSSGIVATGLGGTIVFWAQNAISTYALGLDSDGSVTPGWDPDGQLVATPGRALTVASDGSGGAFLALVDDRTTPPNAPPSFYFDVYAQHVTVNGALAPGWSLDGIPIAVADLWQHPSIVASDGLGGAYLAWPDARNYNASAQDIYAQRITAGGSVVPGWLANGVPAVEFPNHDTEPAIAVDGAGGLVIGYRNEADSRVYFQRLTASGQRMFPGQSGLPLTLVPTYWQERIQLATDAVGNVAAVWADARFDPNDFDVYVKRIVASGATAVSATLIRSEAEPGLARLEWRLSEGVRLTSVFRSKDAHVWEHVGSPVLTGSDRVIFEDRSVQPGTKYAYRLGYIDDGVQAFTAEAWVDVPTAHRFALAGVRPNPVVADVNVHFSLASADRADIELFDLAGRSVASMSLSSPTPGNQHVRLMDGGRLDAGVYWLRLSQGTSIAKSRVVVIR